MSKEIDLALEKLQKAFKQLEAGARQSKTDLQRDGVIQRFEFTYELLWKAFKVVLEDQGIKAITPKESFQMAFKKGYLFNEKVFLEMLKARNILSHHYSEEDSKKIFRDIKAIFIPAIAKTLKLLKINN